MRVGTLIQYRLRLRGLPVNWVTTIQEWEPPHRFVMEWLIGKCSGTEVEVRFADTDAMGHVNNAVYLTYLEAARFAWWQQTFGLSGLTDHGFVVARVEIVEHSGVDVDVPGRANPATQLSDGEAGPKADLQDSVGGLHVEDPLVPVPVAVEQERLPAALGLDALLELGDGRRAEWRRGVHGAMIRPLRWRFHPS